MGKKITLESEKEIDEIVASMKKNSVPWSMVYGSFGKKHLLFKEKNGKIQVCIPWGNGYKMFCGHISKNEENVIIEGEFRIPKYLLTCHVLLWGICLTAMIYLFATISDMSVLNNVYVLTFFGTATMFFLFDIWYAFIFNTSKYEEKISAFLKKCI